MKIAAVIAVTAAMLGVAGVCRAAENDSPKVVCTIKVLPTDQALDGPQKVVLYEEDQSSPNGLQFVGSAVWRTEAV
jgi:hypothetical protein